LISSTTVTVSARMISPAQEKTRIPDVATRRQLRNSVRSSLDQAFP
jgi:hypothetical protein